MSSKIWTRDIKHLNNSEISSAWKGGSNKKISTQCRCIKLPFTWRAGRSVRSQPAASEINQPWTSTATHYSQWIQHNTHSPSSLLGNMTNSRICPSNLPLEIHSSPASRLDTKWNEGWMEKNRCKPPPTDLIQRRESIQGVSKYRCHWPRGPKGTKDPGNQN